MRILYVSQYFPPEVGAPAARVHELSREWVRLGHSVTVLTAFPHHPTGIKAPEDRWTLTRRESLDGIQVQRTYVYASPNRGIVKRMISYASFAMSAALLGGPRVRSSRPDVVIATSPQLLCAAAGYWIARSMGVPFVFEVRDLWPETILAVDAMKENLAVRGLRVMAKLLYNRSQKIVTVGEGYRRGIRDLYGIPESKMDVVPNGIDTSLFSPLAKRNEVRKEFGWGDRFVAMYIGTHGMCQGLGSVLRVAHELRNASDILFVFVGEGAEKVALVRQAEEMRLANVRFIDQQPRERVPLFYAACDLGVVTLRDSMLFTDVLPSKLFEYLGMERPVVLNIDGQARALVESARAGVFVRPGDPGAMAAVIRRLAGDRRRLAEMGRAGRSYVLRHYDRRILARSYLELLAGLCRKDALE